MKHQKRTHWLVLVLFLVGSAFSTHALAETEIGISLNRDHFTPGEEAPVLYVSGFNDQEPRTVDVHVGYFDQDGTIYEFPDWNTSLHPWVSGLVLPQNFEYPATPLQPVPADLPPGIYTAFAALTEPGTINIISLDTAQFSKLDDTPGAVFGSGERYGFVSLSHFQTATESSVSAGGSFIQDETEDGVGDFIEDFQGEVPDLDQCVYSESTFDYTQLPAVQISTLDAGQSLELTSPAGTSAFLQKEATGEFISYSTESEQLDPNFYQDGTYTFFGPGGPDVSPFSVSVSAPGSLTLTQPAVSTSATHNAASDLQLVWNGNGSVGEVYVSISATDFSTSSSLSIDCRFIDDGSAAVPANLLTQLKDNMGDGGSLTTELPGFEVPEFDIPDVDIPELGGQVNLSVSRQDYSLFTAEETLDYGIASVSSGVSMPLTLQ